VDIEGTIGMGKCKPLSLCASGVLNVLDRIKADPNVKALILNVSSNGGEITVTDIIYQAIMDLKKEKNIPVYAFVQRGAYSGGYYIAMAADEITVLPTSFVGSIGVIFVSFDIEETLSKIGVRPVIIKSVEKKDIGIPFRHMTDEERKIIEKEIKALHQKFADLVTERRTKIKKETIGEIANGLHFSAERAKEIGLIDHIAYYDPFLQSVKEKMKLKDYSLVRYTLFPGAIPSIYSPHVSSLLPFVSLEKALSEFYEASVIPTSGYYFLGW
jgi:protease-4